jgi:hypothetical protein
VYITLDATSAIVPNRWNIPAWLELEVRDRDRACVYCGTLFATANARRDRPSWEHIVNDASIVTRENIALCCIGCNASKGTKVLSVWLQSKYCMVRGISTRSVAPIAQAAVAAFEAKNARVV